MGYNEQPADPAAVVSALTQTFNRA